MPIWLLVLACPIGMGLIMWFMMRKQHGAMGAPNDAVSPEERLARLETEKRALEQQKAVAKNNGAGGKRPALRPQDK